MNRILLALISCNLLVSLGCANLNQDSSGMIVYKLSYEPIGYTPKEGELSREFGDSVVFYFDNGFTKSINYGSLYLGEEFYSPLEKVSYAKYKISDTLFVYKENSNKLINLIEEESSEKVLQYTCTVIKADFIDTLTNMEFSVKHFYNSDILPIKPGSYSGFFLDGQDVISRMKPFYSLKTEMIFPSFIISMEATRIRSNSSGIDIKENLEILKRKYPVLELEY